MSVYESPEKYAEEVGCTVENAAKWIAQFKPLHEEIFKAQVCPKCNKPTLVYEGGSYEEGITEYVRCENDEVEVTDEEGAVYFADCEFVDDIKPEYESLRTGYDFDELLCFAVNNELEMLGMNVDEYIEKEIARMKEKNQNKLGTEIIENK